MNQTRKSIYMAFLAGMFVFTLGLAGCEGDSGSSDNTSNARSQAELQAIADQAAIDSGLSGFTSITTANADTVGDDTTGATSESGENPDTFFLKLSPDAADSLSSSEKLRTAVAAVSKAGGLFAMIDPGANHATSSTPVNTTLDCSGLGVVPAGSANSVTVTGTVNITSPDSADGTGDFHISIQNLNMAFTSCIVGTNTIWGELLWNTDDTLSATSTSFSYRFDEFLDGGFVLQDNFTLERWNFTLVSSLLGSWTINSDGTQVVDVTVTVTVNDITCVAKVDNFTDLFFANYTYTCT